MIDKLVLDTNVILSGLRSRNGYAFKLLEMLQDEKFKISISVPLILEYESILNRFDNEINLQANEIEKFINYLCFIGERIKIYYLWRPLLKDPFDDHILELAVAAQSQYIITYNKKDFVEISEKFGIKIFTPKEYIMSKE